MYMRVMVVRGYVLHEG